MSGHVAARSVECVGSPQLLPRGLQVLLDCVMGDAKVPSDLFGCPAVDETLETFTLALGQARQVSPLNLVHRARAF
jgi:hypothetical protein